MSDVTQVPQNTMTKVQEDKYWEELEKTFPTSQMAFTEQEYWRAWYSTHPKPENVDTWGQDEKWANPAENTDEDAARKKYFKSGEICPNHGEPYTRTSDMRTHAFWYMVSP